MVTKIFIDFEKVGDVKMKRVSMVFFLLLLVVILVVGFHNTSAVEKTIEGVRQERFESALRKYIKEQNMMIHVFQGLKSILRINRQ